MHLSDAVAERAGRYCSMLRLAHVGYLGEQSGIQSGGPWHLQGDGWWWEGREPGRLWSVKGALVALGFFPLSPLMVTAVFLASPLNCFFLSSFTSSLFLLSFKFARGHTHFRREGGGKKHPHGRWPRHNSSSVCPFGILGVCVYVPCVVFKPSGSATGYPAALRTRPLAGPRLPLSWLGPGH